MQNKNKIHRVLIILTALLMASGIAQSSEKQADAQSTMSEPVVVDAISPVQLATEKIQPGLKVTYFLEYFKRDVTYLQEMISGEFKSQQGKPIDRLDHQFGRGEVFDSGTNRGVAVRMRGYLNFAEPGTYSMQALSNDGIVLHIDDKLALNDPRQHSDRMSNIAHITIDRAGWFPLSIDYFQRKGTAALRLFWKTPGQADFTIVPGSAYGHLE